jgi:hypothetical protein
MLCRVSPKCFKLCWKKWLDIGPKTCYTSYMLKKRKRRSDRNQAIYLIENTITGEQYIGLTVVSFGGNAVRTVRRRFLKHIQRARTENKDWVLSNNIRQYGPDNFVASLITVIRGKKAAHKFETQMIKDYDPALNTFK